MNLSEYILLPLEQRRSHIDLCTPCEIVPSPRFTRDKRWDFFGIENDIVDLRKAGINRCHLCENGVHRESYGRVCHNPLHFYVGTMSENSFDMPIERRQAGGRANLGVKRTFAESHKQAMRHPKTPRKKMRCLVTGKVMDSGHLTRYQTKNGIAINLREPAE